MRRYKIGKKLTYDSTFDHYKINSPILNPDVREQDYLNRWVDPDHKRGLEAIQAAWFGDESGYYEREGRREQAELPAIYQQIEQVHAKYEAVKKRLLREGKDPHKDMPPDVEEQKQRIEALYDIRMEEAEQIKKWINNYREEERREFNKKMLQKGPQGTAQLYRGTPYHIDYQKCDLNEDGVPIIVDEDSPYKGMSVADYRQYIVKPWKDARNHLQNEESKLRRRLQYKGYDEADIKKEWKKRRSEIMRAWSKYENIFYQNIRGKSIPKWPDNVPNHLKESEKA